MDAVKMVGELSIPPLRFLIMRAKVKTGMPKGTFKSGDLHPSVDDRIFYQYSGDIEVWLKKTTFEKCAERSRERSRKRMFRLRKENPELVKIQKTYNKEARKKYVRTYRKKNQEKINEYQRSYYKEKYGKNIRYTIIRQIRSRFRDALKTRRIHGSAVKNLGCTIEELIIHLESQFQNGMNWENHKLHGWHIDHIKPISAFDLSNPKDVAQACHYTNLQPLWANENLTKGKKVMHTRSCYLPISVIV
jgi:hypothetical protein